MYLSSQSHDIYFVTLTVVDWVDIFTRTIYNDFLVSCLQHCRHKKGLKIYAYVIMTNHLHLVCQATARQNLSEILRDFKTYTSKQLFQLIADNALESRKSWMLPIFIEHGTKNDFNKYHQIWQNGNYPILLDNSAIIEQKINYIHQNPVRAGFVMKAENFHYSSANSHSLILVDQLG